MNTDSDAVASLGGILSAAAARHPDRLALVDGDDKFSYAKLYAMAQRFAAYLRQLGVARGDVVTVQLPNWWETQVAAFGSWLAGAIYNPVVSIYRESELGFIVNQAKPKALVVPSVHRGHDYLAVARRIAESAGTLPVIVVRPPAGAAGAREGGWEGATFDQALAAPGAAPEIEPEPDQVAVLLYTSGSTSAPKGALHSHRTLVHEARQVAGISRLGADDVVFMPSPLAHVTGVAFGTILPAVLGIPSILQDRWDPEVAADSIERNQCTFTVSATPFLLGLTKTYESRHTACNLKVFICGGAEIGPALIRRARRALGTRVVRTYGSTEFPTFSLGDPYGDEAIGADTDGLPVPLSSYRLDQSGWSASPATGELLVRGAELFLGYHDQTLNQDAFDEDGYFRTGDLVRFDDNGACAVVGRKKDIIIRGGENLSAIEIEDLLLQHPAVRDVAVVAMPDPDLGERVCAFVVAATPGARLDSDEVRSFIVGSGLAVQKSPERVELLDELPRTASGKVQKYLLREKIRAIVIAEAEQAQAANQAPRPS